MKRPAITKAASLLVLVALVQGCGGGAKTPSSSTPSSQPGPTESATAAEETRPHDERVYTVDEVKLRATLTTVNTGASGPTGGNGTFTALSGVDTDRWVGVLSGAGYQVEVPRNWNGKLVMYAHGYRGTGPALTVAPPSIREYLVRNGYAWAASSYSRNHYDVRAGIEDTNALAQAFTQIASQNGRPLSSPTATYIIGHSMGGHIAAAAVDEENVRTANHSVRYAGAVPMCGVLGDTELYDFFGAYQVAAQQLAGLPVTAWPAPNYADIASSVRNTHFTTFPSGSNTAVLTSTGERLKQIVKHLTGGERPGFDIAFALPTNSGGNTETAWSTFGRDGKMLGILNRDVYDTRSFVYQFDSDPALSAEEKAFNQAAYRIVPEPDANRLRRDGLRWVPKTNAQIGVPVVTLHTLGDMYVPFHMEQVYKRRADTNGTSQWLVQRAIRGLSHCDFTRTEEEEAFQAMADWHEKGLKPAGDNVLDAATVAGPDYGCTFTRPPRTEDTARVKDLRAKAPACSGTP